MPVRSDSLSGASAELLRFSFPRQPEEALCLADYFAPVDSGTMDVVRLQVVTVGQEATERFDRLQAAGRLFRSLLPARPGGADRRSDCRVPAPPHPPELGLPEGQGKRYSWGYPAIPELDDHRKVFDLLPAEKELGMSLTDAFQLVPEQSTAAIIVHHPEAKYFSMGESRVERFMG